MAKTKNPTKKQLQEIVDWFALAIKSGQRKYPEAAANTWSFGVWVNDPIHAGSAGPSGPLKEFCAMMAFDKKLIHKIKQASKYA